MSIDKNLKDKIDDKNEVLESSKLELNSLSKALIDKKIRFIRKKIKKKLIIRKRKEAFPRKGGKYNELYQDLGKESGVHDNPTKTS